MSDPTASANIERSLGDKLLILGAHLNAYIELGFALVMDHDGGLKLQLHADEAHLLRLWAESMTEPTWIVSRVAFNTDRGFWSVSVSGMIASMPLTVWLPAPKEYGDTPDAVVARLRPNRPLPGISDETIQEIRELAEQDARVVAAAESAVAS